MKKLGVIYVNEQSSEVCEKDAHEYGICGMLGSGKTTIAKVVYEINQSSLEVVIFVWMFEKLLN